MRSPAASSAPSSFRSAASRPDRIHLISDDLTGACDAATAFLTAGYAVRVWLGATALYSTPEPVQAFNTESRSFSPEEAEQAVTRSVANLATASNALIFKKIDSAARGPIAAEVLAASRTLGARAILFAPSFPVAGRTVRKGILEIQDAAGQHTQIPLSSLFPPECLPKIALIAQPDELTPALAAGKTILLCDAVTQAGLEAFALAAASLPRLLYAGSAGLARALASLARAQARLYSEPEQHAPQLRQPLPSAQRTLIVAGTPHAVTQLQLDHLAAAHPLAQILRIGCKPGDEASIRQAFERIDPQALILTGGDTALLAARALDADSFILRGEFAAGIPWGIIQGGVAEERIVITKSGGFGTPATLSDLLYTLSGKSR